MVAHRHVQRGLIDNFNPSQPPILSLNPSISQDSMQSSFPLSKQQTQRFSDPVTLDELLNMQRKT